MAKVQRARKPREKRRSLGQSSTAELLFGPTTAEAELATKAEPATKTEPLTKDERVAEPKPAIEAEGSAKAEQAERRKDKTQTATVFVGGSRHVSHLSSICRDRLDAIVDGGHRVVVGDAAGADKAVQRHMVGRHYPAVTVFCSGTRPRNNLGNWPIHAVKPPPAAKGFSYFAVKDRVMAKEADFGMMIWDGKSPGTLLNILRLVQAGRIAVLLEAQSGIGTTFRTLQDWQGFIAACPSEIVNDVAKRATPEEWAGPPRSFQAVDVAT